MDHTTQHLSDTYNPPRYLVDSCGVLIVENILVDRNEKKRLNTGIPVRKLYNSFLVALKISDNKYYLWKNHFGKPHQTVSRKKLLVLIEKAIDHHCELLNVRIHDAEVRLTYHQETSQRIEKELREQLKQQHGEKLKCICHPPSGSDF